MSEVVKRLKRKGQSRSSFRAKYNEAEKSIRNNFKD